MDDYDKWRLFAPLGLVSIGFGLSLTGEATLRKGAGAPARRWVLLGTLGLCAVNSGIALFGDAVKARARHEQARAL